VVNSIFTVEESENQKAYCFALNAVRDRELSHCMSFGKSRFPEQLLVSAIGKPALSIMSARLLITDGKLS